MNRAYVRVSSADQNPARQTKSLQEYSIDQWYSEKISGKDMDRPELQRLLDDLQPGDKVYVHDLSRLARSTKDLLSLLETFQAAGVALTSVKEKFELDTPMGKLFATVIGAINEFERQVIRERQLEGIALAKAQHRFKGSEKKHVDLGFFEKCLADYNCRRINKTEFAFRLGVSAPTLNRLLQEYETGADEKGGLSRFAKQKSKRR